MESLQHCETDALLVDDLLDFSCGDIGGLCEEGDCVQVTLCGQESESNSCFQGASASYCVEGTVLRTCEEPTREAGELLYSQPDELAGLEWFSSFVEESYKGEDQSIPLVSSEQWFNKSSRRKEEEGHAVLAEEEWSCSWRRATSWLRVTNNGTFSHILDMGTSPLIEAPNATCSSTKSNWDKGSRSRRRSSRSGGRVWTLVPLSQRTHKRPRPAAPAATTPAAPHQEQEEEEDVYSQASSLEYEPYYEAEQGQRKKVCASGAWSIEGRRCSHCQVQKTPQWRAGPLGPKTLCNACGVRYKSGRLLPEYRPAASPTFITELHSNSHKKVLEMRTVKSRVAAPEQDQEEEFSTCSQESMSTVHHH